MANTIKVYDTIAIFCPSTMSVVPFFALEFLVFFVCFLFLPFLTWNIFIIFQVLVAERFYSIASSLLHFPLENPGEAPI